MQLGLSTQYMDKNWRRWRRGCWEEDFLHNTMEVSDGWKKTT